MTVACLIKSNILFVDSMLHLINSFCSIGINLLLSKLWIEKSTYSEVTMLRRIEILSKYVESFLVTMFCFWFNVYTFYNFGKKLAFTSSWLALLCIFISSVLNIVKIRYFTVNDFVQDKEPT